MYVPILESLRLLLKSKTLVSEVSHNYSRQLVLIILWYRWTVVTLILLVFCVTIVMAKISNHIHCFLSGMILCSSYCTMTTVWL